MIENKKRPSFDDFKNKCLEDPECKAEYDRLGRTYEMIKTNGTQGIKCLKCNKISYSVDDIFHHYCANCDLWHWDDLDKA